MKLAASIQRKVYSFSVANQRSLSSRYARKSGRQDSLTGEFRKLLLHRGSKQMRGSSGTI